jgi:hypothetical protein
VLVGARLAARTTEATKLREVRIERYLDLIRLVASFNLAFDRVLALMGSQAKFQSADEWNTEFASALAEVNEITSKVRDASNELSLFTSSGVSKALTDILEAWGQMLTGLRDLFEEPSAEPAARAPSN